MADPIYEKRGDFDNSRLKEALVFTLDGRRVAVFKSHHPDRIGIALDNANGSTCWTITPQELVAAISTTKDAGHD